MDFMKHISNEKLLSFCSGNPRQPGLARTKGEATNRICQTQSEPGSPSLCSKMHSHSKDDENPLCSMQLANTFEWACGVHWRACWW